MLQRRCIDAFTPIHTLAGPLQNVNLQDTVATLWPNAPALVNNTLQGFEFPSLGSLMPKPGERLATLWGSPAP